MKHVKQSSIYYFSQTPRSESISQASLFICNQIFNRELSLNQWRKDKNYIIFMVRYCKQRYNK